jgi:hypothetical protein
MKLSKTKFKNRFASKIEKTTTTGQYVFELFDANGNKKDEWIQKNIVVDEGINKVLNMLSGAQAQIASWYIGIFEGVYTPVASDTALTFPTSATETTAYSETVRPTWTTAVTSTKTLTNAASKATFTFTASKTIQGAFVTSSSVKSSTGGVLLSAVLFSSPKTVGLGDQLQVTYQLSMANA